jgi:integrase
MRQKLTAAFIADPPKPADGKDREFYWDKTFPTFGLQVTNTGHASYVIRYRNAQGISRRMKIGDAADLNLKDARKEAKAKLGLVAKEGDPLAERRKQRMAPKTITKAIIDAYLGDPEHQNLRTIGQRKKTLERLVIPKWGTKQVADIKRSDIDKLLTDVAKDRGPRMAGDLRAVLRHMLNWYAGKTDDYANPMVRKKGNGNGTRRQRILSDDEIRALYEARKGIGEPFSEYIWFLFLTATRRNESARISHTEIGGVEADWTIPATRYKTKLDHLVPLSAAARAVLADIKKISGCPFYFTTDGKKPIGGFGKPKAELDKLMLAELRMTNPNAELPRWTLHDLRRTARTLISRAGIPYDHAERAIGHKMETLRGTYDLYAYYAEKKQAFEALAMLVEQIIHPKANVLPIRGKRRKAQ